MKTKIENNVLNSTTEAAFDEAFDACFAPGAKIDINGRAMDFDAFRAMSKRQVGMTDRKVDWKAIFATDEGKFPPGMLTPEMHVVAFHYTLSGKAPGAETSFVQHRLGSATVDKDGRIVDIRTTVKFE